MYDFIGDIHGHIDELKALLQKLGYQEGDKGYAHPNRKVLFLGDYIDRGPNSPGVVQLVRQMVKEENAIALMGNHEYNAILYNTKVDETFLRKHTLKNCKQHAVTLRQYKNKPTEYQEAIAWFKTLPLYFENEYFRAIHACWHTSSMNVLKKKSLQGVLNNDQFIESAAKSKELYKVVDILCKGLEIALPDGTTFKDKDDNLRSEIRLKWWEDPKGKTIKEMSVLNINMPKKDFTVNMEHYPETDKPVFFGHYWLHGRPTLLKANVCCLDYSVAKEGKLCAYRFDNASILQENNLVWVDA